MNYSLETFNEALGGWVGVRRKLKKKAGRGRVVAVAQVKAAAALPQKGTLTLSAPFPLSSSTFPLFFFTSLIHLSLLSTPHITHCGWLTQHVCSFVWRAPPSHLFLLQG